MNKKPKVLIYDYETSPAKGYFFGKAWETSIAEVIEYEQVLSVAWSWYGEKTVHVIRQSDFKGYRPGFLNDKALVEFFAPIVSQADIVVGHNSDQFDNKVFNTRLLGHHLPPIPEFKSFDTKKLAKSKFHFPSNKLDNIADFLRKHGYDIPRKLPHPGFSMWLGCEAGIPKDWNLMGRYNKQDGVIERIVIEIFYPYMKQVTDFMEGLNCTNPLCQSSNTKKSKKRRVKNGIKYQYQCNDCGTYWTDTKTIKL